MEMIDQLFSSTWGFAIIWFGAMWALIGFVRKVSKDADDDLDPEKRKSFGEDLVRMTARDLDSWIPEFTEVFDRFFGKKHLRWRCFYRSSLISMFTFVVLTTMLLLIEYDPEETLAEFLLFVLSAVVFAALFNVFVDYLSLLETRILLNTRMPLSLKILVDVILTFLLTLAWISFPIWVLEELGGYLQSVIYVWDAFTGTGNENVTEIVRVMIGTAFSTSIWLWLHGLAQFTIRILSTMAFIINWLNVKEKPLRAIGTTINIYVLLLGVVLFPVFFMLTDSPPS